MRKVWIHQCLAINWVGKYACVIILTHHYVRSHELRTCVFIWTHALINYLLQSMITLPLTPCLEKIMENQCLHFILLFLICDVFVFCIWTALGHNPANHEMTNENEKKGFFFRKHTFDKEAVGGDYNSSIEDRYESL